MAQNQDNYKRGTTEFLVLHLLQNEDLYGYKIIQTLSEKSGGRYTLLEGTLYLILIKMEEDGVVESYTELVGAKRKRKYYKITDKGRQRLKELIFDYDEICLAVDMILDRRKENE